MRPQEPHSECWNLEGGRGRPTELALFKGKTGQFMLLGSVSPSMQIPERRTAWRLRAATRGTSRVLLGNSAEKIVKG